MVRGMNVTQTLDYRGLSVAERVLLVEDIWDSIAADANGLSVTTAQKRLLDERMAEHQKNPGDVEPWPAVRDRMLQR